MNITVLSAQSRLDALEGKARLTPISGDAELQSQLARYFCVLASGLIEQATVSLLEEYVRSRSVPRVYRYSAHQISRLHNAKFDDILTLLGRFDPAWRRHIETSTDSEVKAAIDSIVNLRNQIAHGKQVTISLGTFSQYYVQLKSFITDLEAFLEVQ